MNSSSSVSFVNTNHPIDFELQNQGRVLIIKDALYNRSTQRYHDIKLERNGWRFFGWDLGGGGKFTGITDEVVREIQATYGIALKTLQAKPNSAVFWVNGNGRETSYCRGEHARENYYGGANTSSPYGKKADDVFLAQEDARHFGAAQMTLHDAMNAGIWSLVGWSKAPALTPLNNAPPTVSQSSPSSNSERRKALRSPLPKKILKMPQETQPFEEKETKEKRARVDALSADEPADTASTKKLASDFAKDDAPSLEKELDGVGEASKKSARVDALSADEPGDTGSAKKLASDFAQEETAFQEKGDEQSVTSSKSRRGREKQITQLPTIPTYRINSTPIELGYDSAPFEERRRRMIQHLDNSSPVPFSAFVDRNRSQRIDPYLFLRMSDALRRLTANPKADDKDAAYMSELCKHWFRAGYHYLNRNSKPGDGYEQIVSQVSEKVKDPLKIEEKAKELYWRRHATDFWMTFIDLFAKEKIDIDLLRKFLATATSLSSWF